MYIKYDPATSKYPIRTWNNPNYWSRLVDDPFFGDVILYLKGDDFIDSSNIIQSVTINNAVIDNSIKKYGSGSFLFQYQEYLTLNQNGLVQQSDFVNGLTIEWWGYSTSTYGYKHVLQFNHNNVYTGSANAEIAKGILFEGTSKIQVFSATDIMIADTGGVWVHFAITILNTEVKIYQNGILVTTVVRTPPTLDNTQKLSVGAGLAERAFSGNMDSFRITRGIRYTAHFNPETDTYLAY